MSISDINRLKHMLEAAIEAQTFMEGVSKESLPTDRKTIQAVTRNLEILEKPLQISP
jgi:uncharacterized protein with HEPN domain